VRAISQRLSRLESKLGVVESEKGRREREFAETLLRRLAAGRARVGRSEPAAPFTRTNPEGLTMIQILERGRQRALQPTTVSGR
jgi:hypothetical protein